MKREQIKVSDRVCVLYQQEAEAGSLLIQPVDEHDLTLLDQEVEGIRSLTKAPFQLVALPIKDWNRELTPWSAPAVFGKTPFGDGARATLLFITEQLLPNLTTRGACEENAGLLLGGYSLAGLFALWAAYQTNIFGGIAAASPSVWFPQWIGYVAGKRPLAPSVYLSLGDKEERAKHPVMAQVGSAIRQQHALLVEQEVHTILEWNAGNHFANSERRMAKGFAWLLNNWK